MLSLLQLLALGALAMFLASLLAITIVLGVTSTENHQATFGHLMMDPIWFDDNGTQTKFFGADKVSTKEISLLSLSF